MATILYLRLGLVLVALAALGYAANSVYSAGQADIQAKWDTEKAAQATQYNALVAENVAKERVWQSELQTAQDALSAATENTRADLDSTLADVRADNLRLRNRFRACQTRVSSAAGTTGGDDAAGQGGLSREDEELALRIGADADQVAHKLAACQAYIQTIRAEK
jgi:hypothetical protein